MACCTASGQDSPSAAVEQKPEPEPELGALPEARLPFPAVGDGVWVRSRGYPRWPGVVTHADIYEPEEQKVCTHGGGCRTCALTFFHPLLVSAPALKE